MKLVEGFDKPKWKIQEAVFCNYKCRTPTTSIVTQDLSLGHGQLASSQEIMSPVQTENKQGGESYSHQKKNNLNNNNNLGFKKTVVVYKRQCAQIHLANSQASGHLIERNTKREVFMF